jgi:hypothetical protein
VTLNDSADLEGAYFPTGSIVFTLTGPGGTVVYTDTVTVTGNGSYSTATMGDHAGGFTLPTGSSVTGAYDWTASYTDPLKNNNPASDPGTSAQEKVNVKPASPSLVTTASPNGSIDVGINGVTLNDSAVLSGGYFPTGNIVFTLTFNGSTVVYTDTVTVTGNGTYSTATMGDHAGGFLAMQTGSYVWTASYTDPLKNNNPASDPGTSAQERVQVTAGFGGLTPGFWKNNWENWNGSAWQFTKNPLTGVAYKGTDTLKSAFNPSSTLLNDPNYSALWSQTLDQALNFQGGSTVQAAAQILLRQAVAGLLNATYTVVVGGKTITMKYPLTASQIITQVDNALATDNRDTILALASQLDSFNNLGFNIAQKTGKPGT